MRLLSYCIIQSSERVFEHPIRSSPASCGTKGTLWHVGGGGGTSVFYFVLLCFQDVDLFKKEQASPGVCPQMNGGVPLA